MRLFGRPKDEQAIRSHALLEKQSVDVKIRGLGRTPGTVEAIGAGAVLISVTLPLEVDLAALGEPEAILEYTAARGLCRQRGTARIASNGAAAVRFVPEGEAERVQRREFARVDVNIPVAVTVRGGPWPLEFEALDLSGNGIVLSPAQAGVRRPGAGTFVWLRIPLYDGHEPVEARGAVVRERPRGAICVRFDHISEAHRERLVHFVFRQERQQLKYGR
jgi:PilZ domain